MSVHELMMLLADKYQIRVPVAFQTVDWYVAARPVGPLRHDVRYLLENDNLTGRWLYGCEEATASLEGTPITRSLAHAPLL